MTKAFGYIWGLCILLVGFFLYQVKYKVQALEEELRTTNNQILENQDALHVLQAEWQYLNNPERLESLNKKHLKLQPLQAEQLFTIDDFEALTWEK